MTPGPTPASFSNVEITELNARREKKEKALILVARFSKAIDKIDTPIVINNKAPLRSCASETAPFKVVPISPSPPVGISDIPVKIVPSACRSSVLIRASAAAKVRNPAAIAATPSAAGIASGVKSTMAPNNPTSASVFSTLILSNKSLNPAPASVSAPPIAKIERADFDTIAPKPAIAVPRTPSTGVKTPDAVAMAYMPAATIGKSK